MFSLSARFRKSRTPGAQGSVYYIIRKDKNERNITGIVRGKDEAVITEHKDKIAFDLMTIYCVIESLNKDNADVGIDEVYDAATKAILHDNPYADRIKSYDRKYPVYDNIAKIAKIFSDKFERHKYLDSGSRTAKSTLTDYFQHLIKEYVSEGKPFAKSLRSTHHSLVAYLDGQNIPMDKVDSDLVTGYSEYLMDRVSPETASFYIRTLRFVFRRAEEERLLSDNFAWPAGVKTGATRSSRKSNDYALDIATIRQIEHLDLSHDKTLGFARDMFMFGFYTQGMELNDIAYLKHENLSGPTLTYNRRLKGKEKKVTLGDKAMSIVERYKADGQPYLFPIIQRKWLHSYTSARNEIATSLNKIGQQLNPPVKLTFSMNIYSWQSIVMNANIAETIIGQSPTKA